MDTTLADNNSGKILNEQSDNFRIFGPQAVYEISLDYCEHLVIFKPGTTMWYWDGMVNSIKPMWAIMLTDPMHDSYILGFVWDTKTSLSQVTSRDIIGVRCEVWHARHILQTMASEEQALIRDSRNFLGRTSLSIEEIQDEGSSATFKYSL
jgi:hypothetical protein